MTSSGCCLESTAILSTLHIHICSLLKQQLHHCLMPLYGCCLESIATKSTLHIQVCSFVKQQLHLCLLTSSRCCLESIAIQSTYSFLKKQHSMFSTHFFLK